MKKAKIISVAPQLIKNDIGSGESEATLPVFDLDNVLLRDTQLIRYKIFTEHVVIMEDNFDEEKEDIDRISNVIEIIFLKDTRYYMNLSIARVEWQIWSKCFGKVVGINGPTSVGKSTLAKQIAEKLGYHLISVDDILMKIEYDLVFKELETVRQILTSQDWFNVSHGLKVKGKYLPEDDRLIQKALEDAVFAASKTPNESSIEIFNVIYTQVQPYIFSGQNVVIELSIKNELELKMLYHSFNHYPILLSLIYLSLEDNLNRCFDRNESAKKNNVSNFRLPSDIVQDYEIFYKIHMMTSIIKSDNLQVVIKEKIIECLKKAKKDEDELRCFIMESTSLLLKQEEVEENVIDSLIKRLERVQYIYCNPSLSYDYIVKDNSNFIKYLDSGDPDLIGNISFCDS